MSHFTLQMDRTLVVVTGFIQGLGTGMVFLPLSTLAFATLSPSLRADGASIFSLVRSLGNAAGISIIQAVYTTNAALSRSRMVERLTPDNPLMRQGQAAAMFNLNTPGGVAMMEREVGRQSAMVAYVHVFQMMFVATLVIAPMVLLLRKPTDQIRDQQPVHVE
jgi:DHA2 family multidrug resistance protein